MSCRYKLKYFDAKGRAEIVRLMLVLNGEDYEDYRIEFKDWPKEKPDALFGWLPTLTLKDGNMYCDSMGLARYLAREGGYGGTSNVEMLAIDMVTGIVQDMLTAMGKVHFEKDESKKAELKKQLDEETLPKYLKALKQILVKNGSGFFVGKSLTLADVAVFDILDGKVEDSILSQYAEIQTNMAKVKSNDKIKPYIASRKQTSF